LLDCLVLSEINKKLFYKLTVKPNLPREIVEAYLTGFSSESVAISAGYALSI